MHRFSEKYGKPLMAVFMAFLMVTFLLPMLGRSGGGGRGEVIGTFDGDKVYSAELSNTRDIWQTLTRTPIGKDRNRTVAEVMFPPDVVAAFNQNPLLFLLLEKESARMGVSVGEDQLNSYLTNVPGLVTGNKAKDANIKLAMQRLLLVVGAYNRALSAVKVSQPLIEHDLAERMQSINLQVAEINTSSYLDKVPPPTSEHLKRQFDQYADKLAGVITPDDPFGFGYKYPDRAKVQYIVVPKLTVRKMVEASKSPYDWKVDANKYYLQNPGEFVTKASSATKAYDLTPKGPTTKPFSAVEQQIKDQLIDAEVQKTMTQIRDYLTTTMATDYVAYHTAISAAPGGASQPTTAKVPPSSLGVPYTSLDYLKDLASAVQQQFKVLPTVVSLQDKWMGFDELARQPGIGQAHREDGIAFNSYVIGLTAPLLPAEHRAETSTLQVMEPTQPLTDANDSVYIARVTAAEPAHAPPTLAEVDAQVRSDVKTQQAYDQTQADANKLLDSARQKGLSDAALIAKRPLVKVGPLKWGDESIAPLSLTGESASRFTEQAFKLLVSPTTRPASKPMELIQLQKAGRVFVAELGTVQSMWNDQNRPLAQARVHIAVRGQLGEELARSWFDFASVKTRTNWKPNENYKESEPTGPGGPPPPPQPML